MSNDRDDDNPIGWRSIYSDDDRNSRQEGSHDGDRPEESREGNAAKPEGDSAEKRAAGERPDSYPAASPRDGVRGESASPEDAESGEPQSPASEEPASLETRSEAAYARASDDRTDVGYPGEVPSERQEAGLGRRKKHQSASNPETEEDPRPPVRYRRKKGHPVLWSFCIALGLVIIAVGSVLFYVWNGLRPAPSSATPVRITIEKGMRGNRIAEELEQSGLIRNAFMFSVWLKYKDEGADFKAGDYEMTPGMTLNEIVAKLNAGDTIAAETVKFTIPEGFTVTQIADRLAKDAGIDKQKFLQEMNDSNVLNASAWTKQIPADASMKYRLEGYLFPETYEMKKGSTEQDIIARMVAELDVKLGQLPEDWQSAMEERGLTLHQVLTIASLVEREVVIDDERGKVASVIENRLEKKMPLQIDATIQYALGKQKEKLTTDDLKIDSPYNTYTHTGLPPGPIASPSLKSIEAALYPDDTDYLYYVTKKDGSNEHLFATTYKQHQKNIQTSEQNEKKAQQ